MATITITFDTGAVAPSRIWDAIATQNGFTGFLSDGVTVQTKPQFGKEIIRQTIVRMVRDAEREAAKQTAVQSVQDVPLT